MTQFQTLKATSIPQEGSDLAELITLIEELNALIADENLLLARGLPASVSQNIVRKARLSAELDVWLARIRSGDEAFTRADKHLHHDLVDHLRSLQDGMSENMNRLRRAMAVTRRRIDAIMSAVREQAGGGSNYGRSGASVDGKDGAIAAGIRTA